MITTCTQCTYAASAPVDPCPRCQSPTQQTDGDLTPEELALEQVENLKKTAATKREAINSAEKERLARVKALEEMRVSSVQARNAAVKEVRGALTRLEKTVTPTVLETDEGPAIQELVALLRRAVG